LVKPATPGLRPSEGGRRVPDATQAIAHRRYRAWAYTVVVFAAIPLFGVSVYAVKHHPGEIRRAPLY